MWDWEVSEEVADTRITDWQVFTGDNIEERRASTRSYIAANLAEWEESE